MQVPVHCLTLVEIVQAVLQTMLAASYIFPFLHPVVQTESLVQASQFTGHALHVVPFNQYPVAHVVHLARSVPSQVSHPTSLQSLTHILLLPVP